MQFRTQQAARVRQPRSRPYLVTIGGIAITAIVVAVAAGVMALDAPRTNAPGVATPLFQDELAFAEAWYRPVANAPRAESPDRPVVVPAPSLLDDPLAFHAAWYRPFPYDGPGGGPVVSPPSVLDDPVAFHAAWYRPHP